MAKKQRHYKYDVVLSFAGEDRRVAAKLADILRNEGVRVFYDKFEKADLWGKDLYQHFQRIYRDRAKYCIVFVSKHYAKKLWTRHELKQAQARAFAEGREYILPVRLDDTELPGLNPTIGHVTLRGYSVDRLADLILQKLVPGYDPFSSVVSPGEPIKDISFQGMRVVAGWPRKIRNAQRYSRYAVTRTMQRIPFGKEREPFDEDMTHCPDCAVPRGQYHVPSCDIEECPACGEQAISCECSVQWTK